MTGVFILCENLGPGLGDIGTNHYGSGLYQDPFLLHLHTQGNEFKFHSQHLIELQLWLLTHSKTKQNTSSFILSSYYYMFIVGDKENTDMKVIKVKSSVIPHPKTISMNVLMDSYIF